MDPLTIKEIGAAIVIIVGAVGGALALVLSKIREIHILVNSKHSQALNDLAKALKKVAEDSGLEVDAIAAEVAKQAANAQADRVQDPKKPDGIQKLPIE